MAHLLHEEPPLGAYDWQKQATISGTMSVLDLSI
jgi:hypothetical protein